MKFDLATFGESMLRISARAGQSFESAQKAELHVGGAESNVAVALARLGLSAAWASRLTDNALGRRIAGDIARHGVDTSGAVWTAAGRAGLYFVQFNAAPRAAQVTYDRRDSAIARLKPEELDWERLLDTRMLHLTGITPALSPGCRKAVERAIQLAGSKGVPVSFDVNYRAKLWKPAAANKVLSKLIHKPALLIMTQEDARVVFKLKGDPEEVLRKIRERFFAGIAVLTLGGEGALAFDGKELYAEPGHQVREVIDRLGAGDAFVAGLIYGYLKDDLELGLKMGLAMSAMKLGMSGDCFWAGLDEVRQIMKDRGGDVNR